MHDTPCQKVEAAGFDLALQRWQADALAADPAILDLTLAAYFDNRAFPVAARREVLAWWAISGSTEPGLARVGQLLTPKLADGWQPKIDELGFTFAGGVQGLVEGVARDAGG